MHVLAHFVFRGYFYVYCRLNLDNGGNLSQGDKYERKKFQTKQSISYGTSVFNAFDSPRL